MAKKTLGIEIGDRNLKIIECKGRTIVNAAVAQILPDAVVQNGRIRAFNAVGALIRETMKENKIRTKDADIVLPMETYFIKRVKMPKMTVKQLRVNLPYEFHDFIQDDMSRYVFDYSVLGINEKDMDLMIAACPKQLVANYATLCKQAGLRLGKLVPDVLALQTIVMPPEEEEKRTAEEAKQAKEEQQREKKEAKAAAKKEKKHTSRKSRAVEEELEKLGETANAVGEHAPGENDDFASTGIPGRITGTAGSGMTGNSVTAGGSGSGRSGVGENGGSGTAGTGAVGNSAGSSAGGSGAGNAFRNEEEERGQDYVVLDFGHSGTRLHFFSHGAYEITRTMNTNARGVAEQLAQEKSIDVHIAELMLANNQDDVLHEPLIADAYDTMATEIQRVMNFYSYSNPKNTIDKIYYFGDGVNVDEMKSRITEAIGLELEPLTNLIPEADGQPELLLAPQAYGCVLE